ncbi:histidine phosphatase family protein, partial [Candidatus Bathyarchaeota archaeon]|nr:histidine phosphatase family protein [Candidatus Bathyarchaeota archaeon]
MDPITGETTATVLSPTGIPADPPLTSHGVDQANELAAHLNALHPPIDAVYSSPYYRCLQTISPFVALKNDHLQRPSGNGDAVAPLKIRTERGLSEFFGAAHFDHPIPAEKPTLKRLFPAVDEEYQSRVVPSRKGESYEALYQRVRSALENIIEQCDAEGHRTVILCSHAATVIAMGRVLTGEMPET